MQSKTTRRVLVGLFSLIVVGAMTVAIVFTAMSVGPVVIDKQPYSFDDIFNSTLKAQSTSVRWIAGGALSLADPPIPVHSHGPSRGCLDLP